MAKKDPKDGGYYMRSVKALKTATNRIAREAEKRFHLPSGSVRISITKLTAGTRDRLVEKYAD